MRKLLSMVALCSASLLTVHAQEARLPGTFRLTFLGDIMAHEVNWRMADYRDIYRGVEDVLLSDDLTVANLEFPVDPTQPVSGYPFFNARPDYVRAAVEEGVDAFSVANNHAFDGREEGVFQTLRSIASVRASARRPVIFSGIRGNDKAPFLPVSLTVRGVRVGFVAVSQFLNEPDGGRYVNVVDYQDAGSAERFLSFVRDASPLFDLFIVSYHGDREYRQDPDPRKREFFHRVLESGAHIVYGHHPHVVQGFEVVRVGGSRRLALYSMGNFISGMTWGLDPAAPEAAPTGESYLLSVDIARDREGVSVTRVEPIPIANYRNGRGEMVVGKLADLAGGAGEVQPAWKAFFAGRLSLMDDFLSRFAAAAALELR